MNSLFLDANNEPVSAEELEDFELNARMAYCIRRLRSDFAEYNYRAAGCPPESKFDERRFKVHKDLTQLLELVS